MKRLIIKQKLPVNISKAWEFLSDPQNLQKITPPEMKFEITSKPLPTQMYQGMIITYKVRPLMGIPVNWVTEITAVKNKIYFIDNQKAGPYKFWHHQHFIEEIDDGVEMTDILHYAAPFGVLGLLAEKILINKKVNEIFQFRERKLNELFGEYK